MARVHDVLRWANRRAVAEEVTRRGYRVSGETLNRWVRDEKEFPAVVERIVFDLFTIGEGAPDLAEFVRRWESPEPPAWAAGLTDQLLEVIQADRRAMGERLVQEAVRQVRDSIAKGQLPSTLDAEVPSGRRRPPPRTGA